MSCLQGFLHVSFTSGFVCLILQGFSLTLVQRKKMGTLWRCRSTATVQRRRCLMTTPSFANKARFVSRIYCLLLTNNEHPPSPHSYCLQLQAAISAADSEARTSKLFSRCKIVTFYVVQQLDSMSNVAAAPVQVWFLIQSTVRF